MKAVIFGGTTEGRELSLALAKAGADVVVSVASDVGTEEQGHAQGITISQGRKDEAQIRELICGADVVIDATHPYAMVVTDTIARAAGQEGVQLLRVIRDPGMPSQDEPRQIIAADPPTAAQMALAAAGQDGHVLLTTGSKDLQVYASAIDPEHLYARVLPLVSSIEACEAAGIPHRNIIAIQGPFSEEMNRAVLRDYEIDVMITKESGRAGGFLEKIRACESCGVPAVVIARPPEDGLTYDEVLQACLQRMQEQKHCIDRRSME